jgi:hypothetical protein
LDRLGSPFVQKPAALSQQGVVGHVVGQRVLEGVFDINRRRLLVDELARLQAGQQTIEFVGRQLDNLTNQ